MKVHPVIAAKLPGGWRVVGPAPSAGPIHVYFCCEECSPFAPRRSKWEALRVEVRRPQGVSIKEARRIVDETIRSSLEERENKKILLFETRQSAARAFARGEQG
jgi:hypothetical protein